MVVSRHCADQAAILPIPDADGLVIRAGQNPSTVSEVEKECW